MKDSLNVFVSYIIIGLLLIGVISFFGGLVIWSIKFFFNGIRSLGWI